MIKRAILTLVASFAVMTSAAAFAAPAHAYLHLANAQATCGGTLVPYVQSWFAANGYGDGSISQILVPGTTNSPNHSYTRDGDNDIYVLVAAYSVYQKTSTGKAGAADIICHVLGSDPGSVYFANGFPMWLYYGDYGGYTGPLQGFYPAWWVS